MVQRIHRLLEVMMHITFHIALMQVLSLGIKTRVTSISEYMLEKRDITSPTVIVKFENGEKLESLPEGIASILNIYNSPNFTETRLLRPPEGAHIEVLCTLREALFTFPLQTSIHPVESHLDCLFHNHRFYGDGARLLPSPLVPQDSTYFTRIASITIGTIAAILLGYTAMTTVQVWFDTALVMLFHGAASEEPVQQTFCGANISMNGSTTAQFTRASVSSAVSATFVRRDRPVLTGKPIISYLNASWSVIPKIFAVLAHLYRASNYLEALSQIWHPLILQSFHSTNSLEAPLSLVLKTSRELVPSFRPFLRTSDSRTSSHRHIPPMHEAKVDRGDLNILCLDGGGVRGLSSLLILRDIMYQLKTHSNLQDTPLPCDVFDMVCGTSTGGLVAIMLGRLRMSVEAAIKEYVDFCGTVFMEKSVMTEKDGGSAMYDASRLEAWVINMVAKYDCSRNEQASLEDSLGEDYCCRTFVLAVTRSHVDATPKRFRSYPVGLYEADACKIWEAVRATTAAVPFFDAAKVGFPPETFIDGSFSGSNNPSMRAIEEVADWFPSRKIACFLSLGTGAPDSISVPGGHEQAAKAYLDQIRAGELTHDEVWKAFDSGRVAAIGEPYFRFSAARGLEDIQPDEWSRLEELTGITNAYMRDREQERAVKRCLRTLAPRAAEIAKVQEEVSLL